MVSPTKVMTTIIQNIDRAGKDYEEKVDKVEEYMAFAHLPQELRSAPRLDGLNPSSIESGSHICI